MIETLSLAPRSSVRLKKVVDGRLRMDGREQGRDFVVCDMRGQPVAAQQEPVAGVGRSVHDFQFRFIGCAQRAGHDVSPRPGLRLFLAQQAAVNELLDLGVIARNLRELAVAQQIAAAVAAPDAGEVGSVNHERDQRRAENGSGAGVRHRAQVGVDAYDLLFEFGEKLRGGDARRQRLQRRHDGSARDVAAAVAAHAVGHRPEPDVRAAREHRPRCARAPDRRW